MKPNAIGYLNALVIMCLLAACSQQPGTKGTQAENTLEAKPSYKAELKELSDEEYPDNPDIEIRHSDYTEIEYAEVDITHHGQGIVDLKLVPANPAHPAVSLSNLSLLELIPTIATGVKDNSYLTNICLLNQEWNRNQVRFNTDEFDQIVPGNSDSADRFDLARNCLNAYLWEVMLYKPEDGKSKVWYHGWFDFPKSLYAELFVLRNDTSFAPFQPFMENWKDPESLPIPLEQLRQVAHERPVQFQVHNHEMYPLQGERKKKRKEVITPAEFTSMEELLTDSSKFATFTPPGFYNRKDPRHTELSRFKSLSKVVYRATGAEGTLDELELTFNQEDSSQTTFVVGGISLKELPKLEAMDANKGQMYSMGIGNHPFYESFSEHKSHNAKQSKFFALLLDKDGKFLDSHAIGIDGPLLHWDSKHPDLLHLWLLSFERHALISHFTLDMSEA